MGGSDHSQRSVTGNTKQHTIKFLLFHAEHQFINWCSWTRAIALAHRLSCKFSLTDACENALLSSQAQPCVSQGQAFLFCCSKLSSTTYRKTRSPSTSIRPELPLNQQGTSISETSQPIVLGSAGTGLFFTRSQEGTQRGQLTQTGQTNGSIQCHGTSCSVQRGGSWLGEGNCCWEEHAGHWVVRELPCVLSCFV